MAWNGSEKFTPKYVQTKPKEEKKQVSSFYDDFQTRRAENSKSIAEKNPIAKSVSKSKTGNTKKSASTSHTEPKSDLKFNGGYQSYQDRKKNGKVFTPSTVLSRNYGITDGFDTSKYKKTASSTWLADITKTQQDRRNALKTWKETKDNASANKTELLQNKFYNDFMNRRTNGTYEPRKLYDNYGSFDNDGLKLVGIGKKEYSLTNDLNNKMLRLYDDYRNILDTTSGTTQLNALNKLQADNIDIISEFEKQTKHKFSFTHLGEAHETAEWNKRNNDYWKKLTSYGDVRYTDDFEQYSIAPTESNKLQRGLSGVIKLSSDELDPDRAYKSYIDPKTGKEVYYSLKQGPTQYNVKYEYLTEDEKGVYNYLHNKLGSRYADDYLDRMEIILDQRKTAADTKYQEKIANEHKIVGSASSVVSNLIGAPLAYIDSGVQAAKQTFGIGDYRPNNPYSDATGLVHSANASREGVTRDMSSLGKGAYNLGMGLVDNVAQVAVGGKKLSLPLMGASVAGSTAVNRGAKGEADAGKAFQSGTAAGLAEMLAEIIPLNNIFKVLDAPPSTGKGLAKTLFKNSGVEGLEGMFSNVAGNVADRLINGDTSEYERYKQSLIEQGMSNNEATKKAFIDVFVIDTLKSGGQEALSGLVMNTGAAALGAYNDTVDTGREIKDMGSDVVKATVDTGLESHEATSANKYAQKMQGKMDGGRELSDWNVGRQFQKNVQAIEAEESLRQSLSDDIGIDIDVVSHLIKSETDEDGKRRYFELNGEFDGNRKITTSTNGDTSQPATLGHEVLHYIKVAAPDLYAKMETFVMESARDTNGNALQDRINYHINENGYSQEVAQEEVLAEMCETIFGNKSSISSIVNKNPSFASGILDSIKNTKAKLQDRLKSPYTNRTGVQMTYQQLNQLENMYYDGLRTAAQNKDNVGNGEARQLYAGPKAETANITRLSRAEEMEADGEDAETIRIKTGWSRGQEGAWKFEIDDSKMVFDKGGITSNSDMIRRKELETKFINGTITEQEQSELNSLVQSTKDVRKPSVLQDYVQHDELFEAYPFLKWLNVKFDTEMSKSEHGSYNPDTETITLNAYDDAEQNKSVIVHEIQHAIQYYEGFATGASVEYWQGKIDSGKIGNKNDTAIDEADKKYRELFDNAPDALKSMIRKMNQHKINNEYDKAIDIEDSIYDSEYADVYLEIANADFHRRLLRDANEPQNARDLYWNTAGEIEARDAESRMNMTAEERKQNFPKSMKLNGDVVFADGGVSYNSKSDNLKDVTLKKIEEIRNIGEGVSVNRFTSEDIKKAENFAKKYFEEMGIKSPFFRAWFGDWRANDNNPVKVITITATGGKNPRGTYINKDTKIPITSSSVGYDETTSHSGSDKLSIIAMQNIDQIIENSILLDTEVSGYGRGKKSIYTCFMHKFYSPISINGKLYIAKMAVEESYQPGAKDTNKKFYHVRTIKIEPTSSVGIGLNHTPIMDESDSTIKISQLFEIVKSVDGKFNPKESSKVVNDDGTPRVVYHGTGEEFYIFDKSLQGSNTGAQSAKKAIFFTSSRKVAEGYAKDARPKNITELYNKAERLENSAFYTGDYTKAEEAWREYEEAELQYKGEGKIMPVYLDMKNPLVYDFEGNEYREVTHIMIY